jgi:hypothetical protein
MQYRREIRTLELFDCIEVLNRALSSNGAWWTARLVMHQHRNSVLWKESYWLAVRAFPWTRIRQASEATEIGASYMPIKRRAGALRRS